MGQRPLIAGLAAVAATAALAWLWTTGGDRDPVGSAPSSTPEAARSVTAPDALPRRVPRRPEPTPSRHRGNDIDPLGAHAEEIEAFFDIRSDGIDPNLARAALERALRDDLTQKVEAFDALEQSLTALAAELDDPADRGLATAALGEVHADLAGYLEGHPTPAALTGQQVQVYELALRKKADAQWEKAGMAYERALADLGTDHPEHARVAARLADVPEPPAASSP